MGDRRRNTASLYESSASLAGNFVRESSFALAELTLGRGERAAHAAAAPTKPTFPVAAPPPADVWQLVVEEPRPATYVMEPPAAVDKLAEEYIEKVRKRLRAQQYYSGPPQANTLPLPPPPRWNN